MELVGLGSGALLGALAVFGGAVVLLYLLKLRRRRVVVPYVQLWSQLLAERKSSALWSQLKRWWSLLLALCVVALLVAALGDPRRPFEGRGKTVVILVDASASMQATDVEPTRLERAKAEARGVIDNLDAFDRALVAQLDDGATPLSPLTSDRTALRTAVDAIQATDMGADLAQGVRFAKDVLLGAKSAEVVVISDGGLSQQQAATALLSGEDAPPLRYVRVGSESGDNLGITAFSVRRYPLDKTQSEVLLRARNYTEREIRAEVTLSADGVVLHRQALQLAAGADRQLVLRNVPGADRTLEARLSARDVRDVLPADDVAYARLPSRKRTRVALVSEGNRYLEASLLLDEYLRVQEAKPGGPLALDGYDVVLYDAWLPAKPPDKPAFYILPEEPREAAYSPLRITGTVERPFVDEVLEEHPITRFAALRDVNIGRAQRVDAQPNDRVLVGAEGDHPLLVEGKRNGHPFVLLAFDPRNSDLPMRVAWPVLVLNTIDRLAGESADYRSSRSAGEAWEVQVPAGIEQVTLVTPEGSRTQLQVRDGRASFTATRAGLYRLEAAGFEDVVAVNLTAHEEGMLTTQDRLGGVEATSVPPHAGSSTRLLWPWLLAIALAVLAAEWLTFHRRWTV